MPVHFEELKKYISESPCISVKILYTLLDEEIHEEIEFEKQAGPFGDEWAKEVKEKKLVRDEFKNIVDKCEIMKKSNPFFTRQIVKKALAEKKEE